MPSIICRWCHRSFEISYYPAKPVPFIADGTAHLGPRIQHPRRRRKPIAIKAGTQKAEQPPMLWKDVEERARKFFAQKRAERATTEAIAA